MTREELDELVTEGNGRTLILIVCTRYAREDCATNYVRPTLQQKGWIKEIIWDFVVFTPDLFLVPNTKSF